MKSIYTHFFKNTGYVLLGNSGSKIISVLMLPLYTRWPSIEEFGLVDLLQIYSALLIVIVGACIIDAIFVLPSNKNDEEQTSYFTSGFCFIGIVSVIFVSLLPFISYVPDDVIPNSVKSSKWYLCILLISSLFQGYTQNFCMSIDKMKAYSITGFINTLSSCTLSFLLIPLLKAEGYVLAFSLSNMICFLYNIVINKLWKYVDVSRIQYSKIAEMLRYSIPLIPNGIMWWLVAALNKPMVENYTGLYGVGIMAVAQKIPNFLNSMSGMFSSSWQVSVVKQFGTDSYEGFYNKMLLLFICSYTVIGVTLIGFCNILISILADEKFYDAHLYIPLLISSVVFGALSPLVAANFAASKQSKFYFYSTIWGASVSLIANYLLIPQFMIWGAVGSILMAQITIFAVRLYYANRIVQHRNLSAVCSVMLLFLATCICCSIYDNGIIRCFISFLYIAIILITNKNTLRTIINKIIPHAKKYF